MTADTAFPKRTATELLEQLPAVVSEDDWRARLSPDQYYILREVRSPPHVNAPTSIFACYLALTLYCTAGVCETGGHRAAVDEPSQRREAAGGVRVRRVRERAFSLHDQVRERHRLAQLLRPQGNGLVGTTTSHKTMKTHVCLNLVWL